MTVVTPPDRLRPATEPAGPRYLRRRKLFGHHVAATVAALQDEYRKRQAGAVSTMAHLRAAAGRPPGYDYQILPWTRVPDRFLPERPGDEPTATEHAKHTALTLYALHQQSIYDQPMHRDGPSLGAAVSLLSKAANSADAVRRRFAALGTASTYAASTQHLRSLVRLMRDYKIALDYGLLADDLVALQQPGGPARVRAQWGRDFYRMAQDDNDDTKDDPTTINPVGADPQE